MRLIAHLSQLQHYNTVYILHFADNSFSKISEYVLITNYEGLNRASPAIRG